jgi:tetratricopeptide (TPR) repeat protein
VGAPRRGERVEPDEQFAGAGPAVAGDGEDAVATLFIQPLGMAFDTLNVVHESARLSNEGVRALEEYQRTGRRELLDFSIRMFAKARSAAPPDNFLCGILSNLASALLLRYGKDGNIADLDSAISAGRQAIAATPPGHAERVKYLSNLGGTLFARFQHSGEPDYLDSAIDVVQQAVHASPPNHPDRLVYLANLSAALLVRFERAGDDKDLDSAINAAQEAVASSPPMHPDRALFLSDLGSSLLARFKRSGNPADLDTAVSVERLAVELVPPGHLDRTSYLASLADALRTRFHQTADRADLDDAVDAAQQAVDATVPRDVRLAGYLSSLGGGLGTRFERFGDIADLDAAIKAGFRAVEAARTSDPKRTLYLSNVGKSLLVRFRATGRDADLDAGIEATQQAAAATSATSPDLTPVLCNLGAAYFERFRHRGHREDLDAAIDAAQRSVTAAPPDQPNRATLLSNLGIYRYARFEQSGLDADLDNALDCWKRAVDAPADELRVRVDAARSWGAAAARANRTHEATAGYAAAVRLLPVAAWHGLDRTAREDQLAQWAGLAADAAACAALQGDPELAVELLEQGRSIIWRQTLNLRSDLTRLTEKEPHIAERMDRIRAVLDNPVPDAPSEMSRPTDGLPAESNETYRMNSAEHRRQLAREWDYLLDKVRRLNGFEHFLSIPPYNELATAAAGGSVVIVNASRYACHAFIVRANQNIQVVELSNLTVEGSEDKANAMLHALAEAESGGLSIFAQERSRETVIRTLGWLWEVIVDPVLTTLGYTKQPEAESEWPQVWWCLTGSLAALPVHAAGDHITRGSGSTLDRIISSYAPTLTSLAESRQPATATRSRHLTVAMPTSPGQPPLPAVGIEVENVARHFPPGETNHQLSGPQATQTAVLGAIRDHGWTHFACHALQDHNYPDRSGFILWDGILTIADLAALPSQRRELAFLSACQTATGSFHHLDESIHLAAAMQFLGYKHVIATVWAVADLSASRVTNRVYATLISSGRPTSCRSAEALHRAVRALRDAAPDNPIMWAPFIHLGP